MEVVGINKSTPESRANLRFHHVPVLGREAMEGIAVEPGGYYLDATVGGGGHTRAILESAPDTRVLAIDRDEVALEIARENLADYGDRVTFWHGNFADYDPHGQRFDGIIADLGVSSGQLDTPERGFSFRHPAPLDMRMDRRESLTAAEIVNHWSEADLADVFYHYGEERLSRRIARRIVQRRPFQTTTELAEAIAFSVPPRYRHGRIHPATRSFQGLRIAVNRELTSLETWLAKVPDWLVPGGRIGVISFHSLEDRRVKHAWRDAPELEVLSKKPITATPEERSQNPRSRSAKLRLARRLEA